MRFRSVHRHPADATLLALADGELGHLRAALVRGHLDGCWECRARAAELDAEARRLALRLAAQPFPDADRVRAARADFERRRRIYEAMRPSTSGRAFFNPSPRPLLAMAAVMLAVAAGISLLHSPKQETDRPAASTALNHARAAELQLAEPASGIIHQVVQIESTSSRTPRKRAVSKLEVWSDATTGRYSSRLTDESGRLLQASWKPAERERLSFEEGAGIHRVPDDPIGRPTNPVAQLFAGNIRQLEALTFDWLRTRTWTPVSLSEDFASFASHDGVELTMASGAENGELRLSAHGTRNGVTIEATLELDPASYQPRLRIFRVTSAGETFTWAFRSRTAERLAPHMVREAVFTPDNEILRPRFAPTLAVPSGITAPFRLRRATPPEEIEVLYALHRAHSCTRDVVRIVSEPDGSLTVGVLTPDEGSAANVRAALEQLGAGAWLRAEVEARPGSIPHPGPGTISNETQASAYRQVWKEALALVRLAEITRGWNRTQLTIPSAWLLDTMIRDHLRGAENALAQVRGVPEPREGSLSPSPASSGAANWEDACFALFREVDRLIDVLETRTPRSAGLPPSERGAELGGAIENVHGAMLTLRSSSERYLAQKYGIPPPGESGEVHRERNNQ